MFIVWTYTLQGKCSFGFSGMGKHKQACLAFAYLSIFLLVLLLVFSLPSQAAGSLTLPYAYWVFVSLLALSLQYLWRVAKPMG